LHRRAPKQCLNASQKFQHVEGFGEVIISAQFQPDNLVRDFGASRQHEDGSTQAHHANVSAEIQTVPTRQQDVENNPTASFTPRELFK